VSRQKGEFIDSRTKFGGELGEVCHHACDWFPDSQQY
jgi:hypothetical protein